jgi:1-acyl-sn-glycerol-3-phosphate acyltransferase
MRTFRDGVERIIERRPVPVIPMALKGLWGSAFSRHRSNIVYRLYKGFRSCVGLVVGEQVEPEKVSVKMLQDRVQKLYRN